MKFKTEDLLEYFELEATISYDELFVLALYCSTFFRGKFNSLAARNYFRQLNDIYLLLSEARLTSNNMSEIKSKYRRLCKQHSEKNNSRFNLERFFFSLENFYKGKNKTNLDINTVDEVLEALAKINKGCNFDFLNINFCILFNIWIEEIDKFIPKKEG